MSDLVTGSRVERYTIERTLGKGGMGIVYAAVDGASGARVALKTMHAHVAEDPVYHKRFLREARAAMAVPHPSIVHIFEVFEHERLPWIAMELLDGESLEQHLRREQKLPLDRVARIFVHVASAVGTAHALGIVHRDLKPENIFLTRGAAAVKVLDFGIAKLTATGGAAAQTQALTSTGAMLGTPFYMSPEQATGEKRIDHRADIWSLGIILYRCLTGVLPTDGKTFGDIFRKVVGGDLTPIAHLAPDLPPDVADLVMRMLRRPRDERPWDLRDVHTVLSRHTGESAPLFAEAVMPVWDEASTEVSAPVTGAHGTIALGATPASLGLAPPTTLTPAHGPGGTVIVDPASSSPRAPAPSDSLAPPGDAAPKGPAAAPSRAGGLVPLVVVIALAIAAASALLYRMIG